MFGRIVSFLTALLFAISTMAAPVRAHEMQNNVIIEANISQMGGAPQSIHADMDQDCSQVDNVDATSAKAALPIESDHCCDKSCYCSIVHCFSMVQIFGTSDFTTLNMRIDKAEFPKSQILSSMKLEPHKRPPRA